MIHKDAIKLNKLTIDFYLTDDEKVAFERYCEDRMVYPYACGQTLVQDFLMNDAKEAESDEANVTKGSEASVTERSSLDNAWHIIRGLAKKNEMQDEQIAVLDDKLHRLCAVAMDTLKLAKGLNKDLNLIENELNTSDETKDDKPVDCIKILKPQELVRKTFHIKKSDW